MKKMILIFSHRLTSLQKNEAIEKFGIDEFIYLPRVLQNIWSNIPESDTSIKETIKPIKDFLSKNSKKSDLVLVQGDFGAVYNIVNYSRDLGLVPVYSTTKREVEEIKEGDKVIKKSLFTHVRFRVYE